MSAAPSAGAALNRLLGPCVHRNCWGSRLTPNAIKNECYLRCSIKLACANAHVAAAAVEDTPDLQFLRLTAQALAEKTALARTGPSSLSLIGQSFFGSKGLGSIDFSQPGELINLGPLIHLTPSAWDKGPG